MKKLILILTVLLTCASCTAPQKVAVNQWWNAPATQNAVAKIEQVCTQFAINAGLAALQTYAGGGKVDLQEIATVGGINTLYQQATYLRQIQGTAQVLDPVKTAQILEQGGTSKEISQKLAQELFDNATVLIRAGITPDAAVEINAAALDKAAAQVSNAINEK